MDASKKAARGGMGAGEPEGVLLLQIASAVDFLRGEEESSTRVFWTANCCVPYAAAERLLGIRAPDGVLLSNDSRSQQLARGMRGALSCAFARSFGGADCSGFVSEAITAMEAVDGLGPRMAMSVALRHAVEEDFSSEALAKAVERGHAKVREALHGFGDAVDWEPDTRWADMVKKAPDGQRLQWEARMRRFQAKREAVHIGAELDPGRVSAPKRRI